MSTVDIEVPAGSEGVRAAPPRRRRARRPARRPRLPRSSPPPAASPSRWRCSGWPSSSSTTPGRRSREFGSDVPHDRRSGRRSAGEYGALAALAGTRSRPRWSRWSSPCRWRWSSRCCWSSWSTRRWRRVVGTAIEMLAAIPSIIFGMWGLFVLVPFMQDKFVPWVVEYAARRAPRHHPGRRFQGGGLGILTAGLVLAFMILPFITAVSRDVLRDGARRSPRRPATAWARRPGRSLRKISLRYALQRHRRRRLHRPRPCARRDDGRRLRHRQRLHDAPAVAVRPRHDDRLADRQHVQRGDRQDPDRAR